MKLVANKEKKLLIIDINFQLDILFLHSIFFYYEKS